ncbi:MAG: tetratricopeptide repeat protein [Mycoplasmoidaceae bacterium]|nr:tetratricopeptide repeat protein [Mycoplasmoidaceae bacterium]
MTDKQPDFDAIASNITSIIDQGNQISQRLTSSYVIKTYASKLLIYANRYRKYNDLKTQYSEADRLFKTKQYDACIEQLLKIIKQSKKYKNKQA